MAISASPPADTLQAALNLGWTTAAKIRLHLHGKQSQMKVWEALLRIPVGRLKSCGGVAAAIARARRVIKLACQQQRDDYIFADVKRGVISDVLMARLMERRGLEARPHGFQSTLRVWLTERQQAS